MIFIRDTRNGVASLMKASMLEHPSYKDFFVEVKTDKPVNEDLKTPVKSDKKEEPTKMVTPTHKPKGDKSWR